MKKIFTSVSIVIALGLIIASCTIKNNDNITPTYRNQSTGTGANPNIHAVTVTGTQTVTNMATANTALYIGSSIPGWNYNTFASNPTKFVASNTGGTSIEIRFSGPITAGIYAFTSGTPNAGQAQMVVYAAPGQPSDIVWYSKSGSVTVSGISPNFTATFSNIDCLQWSYLFPVVTVTGNMTC